MKEARDLNELMIHDVQSVSDEYQRACTPTKAVTGQGKWRERDDRLEPLWQDLAKSNFELPRCKLLDGLLLSVYRRFVPHNSNLKHYMSKSVHLEVCVL